jgi:hypothetical protein
MVFLSRPADGRDGSFYGFIDSVVCVFFFLSGAGQAGRIQVEMPSLGKSHA